MNDFWSVQADFVHVEVRSRIRIRDRPGPRLALGRKRFTASAFSGTVATFPVGSQNREAGGPIPTAHRDLTGRGIRPGPSTVAGRVWRPATASFSTVFPASARQRRFSWRRDGGTAPPSGCTANGRPPGFVRDGGAASEWAAVGRIGKSATIADLAPNRPAIRMPFRVAGSGRPGLARGQSIIGASPSS